MSPRTRKPKNTTDHMMSLRTPKLLHEAAVKRADGRAIADCIRRLLEKWVKGEIEI